MKKILVKSQEDNRQLPYPRYFKSNKKTYTVSDCLSNGYESCLIYTKDTAALTNELQAYCSKSQTPWYVIHESEELLCNRAYIHRYENLTGVIRKGPGGPLYEFMQQYPYGILITNYDRFSPAHIARFNSMYDQTRLIDGVAIPQGIKLVGVMNPDSPRAYLGADFLSRFKMIINLEVPRPTINPLLATASHAPKTAYVIELAGGDNWEARLIGHWVIEGTRLILSAR